MRDERAGEAGATLAERLAHMRVIGAGWCGEATYELLIDVAIAAERRRRARWEYDTMLDEDAEPDIESGMWQRCVETLEAEDAALAALEAHVRGNAEVTT